MPLVMAPAVLPPVIVRVPVMVLVAPVVVAMVMPVVAAVVPTVVIAVVIDLGRRGHCGCYVRACTGRRCYKCETREKEQAAAGHGKRARVQIHGMCKLP